MDAREEHETNKKIARLAPNSVTRDVTHVPESVRHKVIQNAFPGRERPGLAGVLQR